MSESHQQRQQQQQPSGLVNGAAVVELTQEGGREEGGEKEGEERCARALARSLTCAWASERAGPRCSLTLAARPPAFLPKCQLIVPTD